VAATYLEPPNSHNDPRHITLADLSAAADAAGITLDQAVQNIVATVASLCAPEPVPEMVPLEVAKADGTEQRYVLGVAYQPGPDPLIAKGVDGGRDMFTEVELEKAAWSLLRNGPRSGLFHIDGTDAGGGAAQVVESYIYRNEQPWDLGDGIVVRKGTWLVGAILTPKAWDLYKAGRIGGFSPQGVARRRKVRPAA
jgi:hypothetical protein